MSAEAFNSLAGYSVGIPPIPVIDANGNLVTNVLTVGNVTAGNIYSDNYRFANGQPLSVYPAGSNTQVQFNNNGSFGASGNLTFDITTGTLVATNFAVGNRANLGNVGNVTILGGSTGYVLRTDGAGNLSWIPQISGAGGTNTSIQFNDGGVLNGSSAFTYNSTTNTVFANTIQANTFIGNLQTSGNISADKVIANEVIANSANLGNSVTANYFVGNLYGTANTALTADTATAVTASAQPNITSVGTLVSLDVAGNIEANNISVNNLIDTSNITISNNLVVSNTGLMNVQGNANFASSANVNLGSISNVHITGGTNGYVLSTDGTGNLSWIEKGIVTPGGSNTQVQYNDSGALGGSAFFTFNEVTNTVNVAGNLIANSLIMGSGAYRFSTSNVYAVTTVTSTPNQPIFQIQANTISGIDFTVVSTDLTGNKRQISKLSAVVLGNTVNYNEVSTLAVNGYTGDFSIGYDPGNVISPPQVVLYFSPNSANLMSHRMNIIAYDA